MDYFEDDIFELSYKNTDDEAFTSKCNPIEEHLIKQLNAIQSRIDKTKNEIEETEQTVKQISNTLLSKAVTGQDTSPDSNSDLYTIEGEPVIKNKCIDSTHSNFLLFKRQWQYVLIDKWVIGVVLQNASLQPLHELRFFAFAKGTSEIHGVSAFWEESDDLWRKIDAISPRKDNVVATLVLDPLDFENSSSVEIYGTITYEKLDVELQVVVPVVNFSSTDILHRNYELDFSGDARYAVLALRSTFVETLVKLPSEFGSERMSRLLQAVNAKQIAKNVYSVDNTKFSIYAMIEVLSSTSVRVSAKTASHLKLILCTLEYEVSIPVTSAEEESCIEAAKALIEELETYLGDPDLARMQRARIKSDLLIP